MNQLETIEISQNKLIKEFEKKFYHQFGVNLTIIKGGFDELMLNNIKYDSDMLILKRILNNHISKELKKTTNTIFNESRKREIVELRMIFCKMARERGLTLEKIGRICNRTHTNIAYNINCANFLLEKNIKFQSMYNSVTDNLNKYYKRNAGIIKSIDKIQNISKSVNIIKLYPGEYKDSNSNTRLIQ